MSALLLTPAWLPDESWPGFLLRLAISNGHTKGVRALADIVGVHGSKLIISKPGDVLQVLGYRNTLGGDSSKDSALERLCEPRRSFYRSGRSRFTAVCSQCLSQAGHTHVPVSWEKPFEFFCKVHRSVLLRRCMQCDRSVSIYRRSIETCDCGWSYRLGTAVQQGGALDTIRHVLQIDQEPERPDSFAAASSREISAIDLIRQLALLTRIAKFSDGVSYRKHVVDAWLTDDVLALGSEWFEVWPDSFERCYREYFLPIWREGRTSISRRTLHLAEFPAVDKIFLKMQEQRTVRRSPSQAMTLARRSHIGVKAVMELTGMHHDTVMWWIEQGKLGKPTRIEKGYETSYLIEVERVREVMDLLRRTVSLQEMVKLVGLSVSALHALVQEGVYATTKMACASYTSRVNPSDVLRDVEQLKRVACGRTRKISEMIHLSQAIARARKRPAGTTRRLWEHALDGRLVTYCEDATDPTLAAIYVRLSDLRAWFRRYA